MSVFSSLVYIRGAFLSVPLSAHHCSQKTRKYSKSIGGGESSFKIVKPGFDFHWLICTKRDGPLSLHILAQKFCILYLLIKIYRHNSFISVTLYLLCVITCKCCQIYYCSQDQLSHQLISSHSFTFLSVMGMLFVLLK